MKKTSATAVLWVFLQTLVMMISAVPVHPPCDKSDFTIKMNINDPSCPFGCVQRVLEFTQLPDTPATESDDDSSLLLSSQILPATEPEAEVPYQDFLVDLRQILSMLSFPPGDESFPDDEERIYTDLPIEGQEQDGEDEGEEQYLEDPFVPTIPKFSNSDDDNDDPHHDGGVDADLVFLLTIDPNEDNQDILGMSNNNNPAPSSPPAPSRPLDYFGNSNNKGRDDDDEPMDVEEDLASLEQILGLTEVKAQLDKGDKKDSSKTESSSTSPAEPLLPAVFSSEFDSSNEIPDDEPRKNDLTKERRLF